MSEKYSIATYEEFQNRLFAEIRQEAFGEDIGQFSWITADEFRDFLKRLEIGPASRMLDIACGSGGLSLYAAELTGCSVTGLDLSEDAVATATKNGTERGLTEKASFFQHDASTPLPLPDEGVDAILCIDAINHVFNREELFSEWKRVLRPGGRFLFTDAVVVADRLRRDEILARSSGMGEFIFTPVGINEKLIELAGFEEIWCGDVTSTIASTAHNWYEARRKRRESLLTLVTVDAFEDMQRVLFSAFTLARDRRLLRLAFSARKKTS